MRNGLLGRWYGAMAVALCMSVAFSAAASSGTGPLGAGPFTPSANVSPARIWNEQLLNAIRLDTPRPTVHARNLFHTSVAMWDAWSAFDPTASGYLFEEKFSVADTEAARQEAISFAAYRLLRHRFQNSGNAATTLSRLDSQMDALGYDKTFTSTIGSTPAAIGNRIAHKVIEYGWGDGANEVYNYADTTGYASVNPKLDVAFSGTTMNDPNRWQELIIGSYTTQNGIVLGESPSFITPQWNNVRDFALPRQSTAEYAYQEGVHYTAPPMLTTDPLNPSPTDAQFKEAALRVIRLSSHLDPDDGVTMDISPGAIGNNPLGSNSGTGYAVNPVTGLPYAPNVVKRGDFGRVLAEFWADGPASETPPGHWNTLANYVSDQPSLTRQIGGSGPVLDRLQWDVKMYLSLNGAVHDAGVVAWGLKELHDYVRPISIIRYMGGKGQSSNPSGPSYDPQGLPLEAGLVEVITADLTAPGQKFEHLLGYEGKIAIYAWGGQPGDPATEYTGSEWILAEDWVPYQRPTFVTPAFPGFISGHSTFSRSAAEVMALFTGSEYFPGGLGTFDAVMNEYLVFEEGPSETIQLQWATYFDAADQSGLSRIYGGIHVDADDFIGRILGHDIGIDAFYKALGYFDGTATPVPEPATVAFALAALGLLGRRRRRAHA